MRLFLHYKFWKKASEIRKFLAYLHNHDLGWVDSAERTPAVY